MPDSLTDLPVKASEAAAIADLVTQELDGRAVTAEMRRILAAKTDTLGLEHLRPCWGSLQQGPVHRGTYYLAADAESNGVQHPLLLRIAAASSPASSLFPDAVLVGRMRPGGGREVAVHAIPFSPQDDAAIAAFAERIDRVFLPRPQRAACAISVGSLDAFDAFAEILASTGNNLAAISHPSAAWAAIRAGWRTGYTAEAEPVVIAGGARDQIARSLDAARETIRRSARCTKFTTDTSRLFNLPPTTADREWMLDQFSRPFDVGTATYRLAPPDILSLNARLGLSLQITEELYDDIADQKRTSGAFDFEPSLRQAETPTTPEELLFYLHWLRARGRPTQLIAPNLGPDTNRLPELAAIARHFDVTLTFHSSDGDQPDLLHRIAQETAGRWNYKVSAEQPGDKAYILHLASHLLDQQR